jgi:amidohydrolase
MRNTIHKRLREVVEHVAASAGATAEVNISMEDAMLVNDPALTEAMAPTLASIAGKDKVHTVPAGMGAEDFAYFAQQVPGFYFSTGAMPKGKTASQVLHHTPEFMIDEAAMLPGVKALCHLTVNYMQAHAPK